MNFRPITRTVRAIMMPPSIASAAVKALPDWRQLFFPVNDNYFSRSPIVAQTFPNE